VAVGDFNGDGKLDLAVASFLSNTLSILLGDGTGNFTLASSPVTGEYADSVAIGDFNGDGKPDLAVATERGVLILLGDGSGNFTLASSPGGGVEPYSLAVGDFNGDGKLDLSVVNWDTNAVSILLQVPAVPAVTLSPTSLIFGRQLFGTSSSPQPVTLTNTGNATLNISKVVVSPNFSQTNNCPRKLQPGGQCTANVVFTPHNVNTITGTITITDNAPNSPQTVPLTGVGTAVTLLPSSLDFGSQPVGTTSQPQTVTFTNYAPKAVTISGGGLTGANAGSFALSNNTCGTSVPAGGSCTISVTFTPKRKGQRTATLKVDDNGGASPQTVALSGTGT
jgi:VCBS repeat protein/centrosomal CEP192-like protein/FG-GAP repeat protein